MAQLTQVRASAVVALAASSWGFWSVFIRQSGMPPAVNSVVMLVSVGVFALPFALAAGPARWDRVTVLLLAGLALADALNMVTIFAAFEHAPVAVAVMAHYLAPVIVALASPWIERMRTRGAVLAALVATGGLALVLEPWRELGPGVAAGAAFGAVSALGYASYVFIARRLMPRIGAARALSYHGLIASVLLLPVALPELSQATLDGVLWIAGGSLLLAVLGGFAFMAGLAVIGSAKASILAFAEPVVAVLVGWLAYDEQLSALAIAGVGLIIGAGIAVVGAPAEPFEPR